MSRICGVDEVKIGFAGKVKLGDGTWVCNPHWKEAGFSSKDIFKIEDMRQLTINKFKEILNGNQSGSEYFKDMDEDKKSKALKINLSLVPNALIQPDEIDKVQIALSKDWDSKEDVLIALKGAFKEYLIVTNSYLYIFKSGFMTGHLAGQNRFKMPISNITNVDVNTHFITGYFEVAAGGIQNQPRNYWSNDSSTDPSKSPNTVSLNTNSLFNDFKKAADIINDLIMKTNSSSKNIDNESPRLDSSDELRKYKSLLDDGIINKEEFNAKKKQLLNL